MNNSAIQNFLSCYTFSAIIIAVIVCALCFLLEWALKDKYPTKLKAYAPAFLAIILQFIYNCIFVYKAVYFTQEVLYSGIICSSLSTVFTVFIKKLKSGKGGKTDALIYLIEGILEGIVCANEMAVLSQKVAGIINSNIISEQKIEQIMGEIATASKVTLTDVELNSLGTHILNSANALKNYN